eukprot:jgi/Hompol1/183/HPOL_002448-RA
MSDSPQPPDDDTIRAIQLRVLRSRELELVARTATLALEIERLQSELSGAAESSAGTTLYLSEHAAGSNAFGLQSDAASIPSAAAAIAAKPSVDPAERKQKQSRTFNPTATTETHAALALEEVSKEQDASAQLNDSQDNYEEFEAPEWCVPIKANVLDFEWDALAEACQFDIISMDPPWQLASHAPTRGVAIGYQQLPDQLIECLPIEKLQTNGFIFIWVINNKYAKAFDLMTKWGYKYVDDITWVKQTVNRRMAKGHGYYLQHAKETCLVGRKGQDPPGCRHGVSSDVIFSERRGQSQKPEEIYLMMEELVPNGKYLEIFGRKNNLRDYWITIGNEL